ncbi:MAG: hypothetical protein R3B09_25145 [Nannocystaceae bacterium]
MRSTVVLTYFVDGDESVSLEGFPIQDDGTLGPPLALASRLSSSDLLVGHFDGGPSEDALLLHLRSIATLLGVSPWPPPLVPVAEDGNFTAPVGGPRAADFNGDGVDDVVYDLGVLHLEPVISGPAPAHSRLRSAAPYLGVACSRSAQAHTSAGLFTSAPSL